MRFSFSFPSNYYNRCPNPDPAFWTCCSTASRILFSLPYHPGRFRSPKYPREIGQTIDKEKCGRANVSPGKSIPRTNVRKGSPAHPQVRGVDMADVSDS